MLGSHGGVIGKQAARIELQREVLEYRVPELTAGPR